MDKATPTPSPASVDSFKFNKAVDPMPGHELCGDYARALLAAQPSGTNLAQECAKARRHGFLDALSSGTARELCALLRRGVNQLEAWHAKYGEHQPQWLPPAGDVRWMEDVAAALDGRAALRAEVERLAAQAAPTEQADLRQLMGMNEAEIDAELLAAGISPDDAVKRADRAIKGALATVRAERRAIEYGDIVHKQVVAMRAAVVAAKLESPEVGIQWIANTLFGPGHYPDIEAARELGGAQALFDKESAELEAFRAAHPAPVAAQPSQAPVVQAVPENCGTGYCSCIECVVEPDRASSSATIPAAPFAKDSWQHAVDNQLVAFGRTSQEFANPHEALAWLAIMNMELGQSNAGATTQAVRFMTSEELNDVALSEQVGWGPGEYVEAVQLALLRVNAGRTIPADGVIGGAA